MTSYIQKVHAMSTSWVLTIPQGIEWQEYEKELDAARGGALLNYRVAFKPSCATGDRCYVVWRGRVRGWHAITGVVYHEEGFACTTTGTYWRPGYYVQRSGEFHLCDGPEMKGFQGFRRFLAG